MDPDANLARQRELAELILSEVGHAEYRAELGTELAELAQALDEWLSRRGFPPKAWERR